MPTSLGISVGTSGVNSALRTEIDTQCTTQFRRLSSEGEAERDLGDLVFDAISLSSPGTDRYSRAAEIPEDGHPENITVAYRTDEQAAVVRMTAERKNRAVRLVPETSAALAYLYTVGVRPESGAIALVDIGAAGMTVSVLDQSSGTVLRSARTENVSGNELAARVYDHVRKTTDKLRVRRQIDPDLLAARCQGLQELLATSKSARIDIAEAGPDVSVTLTRAELDDLTTDLAEAAAAFTREICTTALPVPRSLALIGGAASSTAIADAVAETFAGDVLRVPDPGAATAIGAAVLGDSSSSAAFPLVGSQGQRGDGTSGRISGTVAGVLVLSAVLAGFVTQHFTERDTSYAPVSPLFTSGASPTPESGEASSGAVRPSPENSDPVSSFTQEEDRRYPETVPWPSQVNPPWTSTDTTVSTPSPPTTVTPTPIDQVPTPGLSAEGAPPSRPEQPGTPSSPDFSTPPEDTTVRPDTSVPDTTSPDTTNPDTTNPDTTSPDTTIPDTSAPDPTTPDTTSPPPTSPAPEDEPDPTNSAGPSTEPAPPPTTTDTANGSTPSDEAIPNG